ncbi:hypothetical protein Scep_005092 [Stephania cephalantha]|uniref:Uncharacterized protein n=1 Tax=Stephania cephalantha TaxID=152367 RepID=A0AAP0KTM8_9MAGN
MLVCFRQMFDEMPNRDEKGKWVFGERALIVLLLLLFFVGEGRERSVCEKGRKGKGGILSEEGELTTD